MQVQKTNNVSFRQRLDAVNFIDPTLNEVLINPLARKMVIDGVEVHPGDVFKLLPKGKTFGLVDATLESARALKGSGSHVVEYFVNGEKGRLFTAVDGATAHVFSKSPENLFAFLA